MKVNIIMSIKHLPPALTDMHANGLRLQEYTHKGRSSSLQAAHDTRDHHSTKQNKHSPWSSSLDQSKYTAAK